MRACQYSTHFLDFLVFIGATRVVMGAVHGCLAREIDNDDKISSTTVSLFKYIIYADFNFYFEHKTILLVEKLNATFCQKLLKTQNTLARVLRLTKRKKKFMKMIKQKTEYIQPSEPPKVRKIFFFNFVSD